MIKRYGRIVAVVVRQGEINNKITLLIRSFIY